MIQVKSILLLTLISVLLITPAKVLGEGDDDVDTGPDMDIHLDEEGPDYTESIQTRASLAEMAVDLSLLPHARDGLTFIRIIRDYLQYSSGAARIALIGLLQRFDMNNDYVLSADEIKLPLTLAFANPEDALASTFLLYDRNRDTYITRYELTQYNLLIESSDKSAYEIWKDVSAEFYEKDINKDNKIDIDEFIMYDLYDIGKAIAQEMDGTY